MLAQLFLAWRRGVRLSGFEVGVHGHLAVGHALQLRVNRTTAERGQDALETPLALLGRVVVVLFGHRLQVHQPVAKRHQPVFQVGEPRRQAGDHLAFETGVVDEDRPGCAAHP